MSPRLAMAQVEDLYFSHSRDPHVQECTFSTDGVREIYLALSHIVLLGVHVRTPEGSLTPLPGPICADCLVRLLRSLWDPDLGIQEVERSILVFPGCDAQGPCGCLEESPFPEGITLWHVRPRYGLKEGRYFLTCHRGRRLNQKGGSHG
jgi:hypothetical protein